MEIKINGLTYEVKRDQTFNFNLENNGKLLVTANGIIHTENDGSQKVSTTFDATGRKVSVTEYDSHIHADQPVLIREFDAEGSPILEKIFDKAYTVGSQLLHEEKRYGPLGLTDHFYKYKAQSYNQWNEFRGDVDEKGNPIHGTMLYHDNQRLVESFQGWFYPNGSEREGTSVFSSESIYKSISSKYNEQGTPIAKQIIEFKENDESHRLKLTETYDSSGNMVSGKLVYKENNPLGVDSFEGIFYNDILEPKQGKMMYIENRVDHVVSFDGSFDKEGNTKEGLIEYDDLGPFIQYEGKFTKYGFFKEGYLEYNQNDKGWFSFKGTFDKENKPDKGTIHYLYDLGETTSDGELPGVKWTGKVDFKSDGDFEFFFPHECQQTENIRGYLNEDGVYCSNFQRPAIEKKHMEKYYLNIVKLLRMKVTYTESKISRKRNADCDLVQLEHDTSDKNLDKRTRDYVAKRTRDILELIDNSERFVINHPDSFTNEDDKMYPYEDDEEATILSGPVHELP